jgi:hypothetical protein
MHDSILLAGGSPVKIHMILKLQDHIVIIYCFWSWYMIQSISCYERNNWKYIFYNIIVAIISSIRYSSCYNVLIQFAIRLKNYYGSDVIANLVDIWVATYIINFLEK